VTDVGTSLSLALVALAAAALAWPGGIGRGRLAELRRPITRAQRDWVLDSGAGTHWVTRRCGLLVVGLATGAGAVLAGLGGGLASAIVTGTVAARWRTGHYHRVAAIAATGLSDALGVLVAELRAGAHPAAAVQSAADTHADGSPDVVRILAVVAAAARLGGDVPAVLRGAAPTHLRPWLDRLADAWALAERHGIPLADLLDAVRCDTEHRVRFAADVQARLAGPRATAAVLAGLPLLGLALGQAVGAAPLRVLRETPVGQVLLVLGTGLACGGALWSARLISRAVPA
jgi:tight adherence protein B